MNLKYIIIGIVIIFILYIIYLLRYEALWSIRCIKVKLGNKKRLKDLQKKGTDRRALSNQEIKKYIIISKKYLKKLNRENKKLFKLNEELERHLRYSKFSEKYVLELFYEILKFFRRFSPKYGARSLFMVRGRETSRREPVIFLK